MIIFSDPGLGVPLIFLDDPISREVQISFMYSKGKNKTKIGANCIFI
jgi:hypothetical protein